jgi:pyrimidine-nucleoside phosphorylase
VSTLGDAVDAKQWLGPAFDAGSTFQGWRVTAYEIIRKKREGGALEPREIEFMVTGFLGDDVADYQMAAFLMAVFFAGMDEHETETLTKVMLESGTVLDLSSVPGAKVDKHSTGGVGDKLSLVAAPIAAAAGVRVPMISGRGLGHTGGTLDKLESIPGMRTDLSQGRLRQVVVDAGMAIVGQSPEMVPADRKMYELRDVTATIECIPLIVSSILSKKLAAGLDALVLDVKVGRGAFMGDIEGARALAKHLISTARRLGLSVSALITDMDSPLGLTVGNSLEVAESVQVLKGGGPRDVRELSLELAARMILLAGLAGGVHAARALAEKTLDEGGALETFVSFVEAQGGSADFVDRPDVLPRASIVEEVRAASSGYVQGVDALEIGLASVALGAGRRAVGDAVDPAVGIEIVAPLGAEVATGDSIARIHANDRRPLGLARPRTEGAFRIGTEEPAVGGRLIEVVE